MIRVLIADDHAVVRRGLKDILADSSDIVAAGEAGSGQETLQAARSAAYDVVLLDIALPDLNGLEVLKQLRALQPDLHVVILSVYSEEQYALRALKAGASGYLTKNSAPEELLNAVRTAQRGGRYISHALAEKLAGIFSGEPVDVPHERLSDREYEVLRRLAAGETLGKIAAELTLSPKTVTTYRARILQKLKLKSTAELIRYAIENGLVE